MTDFEWDQCNARVETLILVPAATSQGEGTYPDAFKEDFCESLPDRADADLYVQCPPLAKFADVDEWPDADLVAEALIMSRCNGFLVQAAQPVVRHFYSEGGGFSYSWGHYHTEWLYAPTADDIAPTVEAWSVKTLEADRAKAAKAGAA